LTNTSSGWTSIDNSAFQNTALTYIEIPETVTAIGAMAFLGTRIISINIPASVTSIGDNAFSQASSLASVTFTAGSGLLTIGIAAFIVTTITSISIPATVTSIGTGAFAETALTSVIFERTTGAITIGQYAFADNTSLSNKTIYISTSVASSLTGGPLTSPSTGTTTFYGATVYLAPTFKPTTKADLVTEVGNWCAGTPNTPHISLWDTSQIDNMSNLFEDKTTFNDDIGGWDVSSVTDMNSMFKGASAFNQQIDNWESRNITYTVTVVSDGGNKYVLNGDPTLKPKFYVGKTYTFDLSDNTNSGHPLVFYSDTSLTVYDTTSSSSSAGSPGASVTFTPTTSGEVYLYCINHGYGMGSYYNSITVYSDSSTLANVTDMG
jgi:hypothetical protein